MFDSYTARAASDEAASSPFTKARIGSRATALAAALLMAACSSGSDGDTTQDPDLGPLVDELRTVVTNQSIQPVPDPPSLSADLVELGRALYFDKELSGDRDVSCATCHLASQHGSDGRTLPAGVGGAGIGPARIAGSTIPRHSPMNLNAFHGEAMFWDGRVQFVPGGGGGPDVLETPAGADLTAAMMSVFTPGLETLAAQAMFPPTSRDEMRGQSGDNEIADEADGDFTAIWDAIIARLVSFPTYVTMFQDAYPGLLVGDIHMGHVGNALAAFQAVEFGRIDSPFQAFLGGDDAALSAAQLRGAIEFFAPQSRCTVCHSGPFFSDFRFHNIGMPQIGPGKGNGVGNDDDFGRENTSGNAADRYRFRTPSLLNVGLTAPYGHAGQYSTLRAMVDHYRNAENRLLNYDIMEHVSDSSLFATQVANQSDVIARLAPAVDQPIQFNVDDMTAFMHALTATSAVDLSSVVPASVPSGATIDQ
ncbi:MAG: cytochrome c peroxidase [Planctomycetota bacterium]